MDAIKNPFSPGAGSPPPELVGREVILEQARILLGRVKEKRPEKSILLTGLRGVGKTVLLNEIERVDQNFFRVRFDRLTPSEKRFLRAMAGLGSGAHRSSDIADALKVEINSIGPGRANLIRKGMIYSPAHGDMAFTVPLFNEFMLRAMPQLDSK